MTYPPAGQPPQPGGQPPYGQQPPGGQPPYGGPPQYGQPHPGYPGGPGGFGPPPEKNRTPLIIGIIAALIVAIGGVGAGVYFLTQDDDSSSEGTTAAKESGDGTPEEQVEAAIRDYYAAIESEGMISAADLKCQADREALETKITEKQKKQFERAVFTIELEKIDNIVIHGDTASADVPATMTISGDRGDEEITSDEEFLRKEDGEWKVCGDAEGSGS